MENDPASDFLSKWLDLWQQQSIRAMTSPDAVRVLLDMMERSSHAGPHEYDAKASRSPVPAQPDAVAVSELERRLRNCEIRIAKLERRKSEPSKSRSALAKKPAKGSKKKN